MGGARFFLTRSSLLFLFSHASGIYLARFFSSLLLLPREESQKGKGG